MGRVWMTFCCWTLGFFLFGGISGYIGCKMLHPAPVVVSYVNDSRVAQLQAQIDLLKKEAIANKTTVYPQTPNSVESFTDTSGKYEKILSVLTEADLAVISQVVTTLKKRHPKLRTQALYRGVVSCAVAAKVHKVPFKQAVALALVESTFDFFAVSQANCKGLTQLSALIWRSYSPKYGVSGFSVFNPVANAVVGVGYLKELTRSHSGNTHRALVFYNGGSSGHSSCHLYAAKVLRLAATL